MRLRKEEKKKSVVLKSVSWDMNLGEKRIVLKSQLGYELEASNLNH